jgi:hypothetical protein
VKSIWLKKTLTLSLAVIKKRMVPLWERITILELTPVLLSGKGVGSTEFGPFGLSG